MEGWQRFTTGLLMTEKHIRAISAQPGENNKPQSATVMFTASSENPGAVPSLRFIASFKLQFEDFFKCKMAESDHSHQADALLLLLHTHTHTQCCLVSLNIHLVNYSQP